MDEWKGDQKPPFSMKVWQFIQAAGKARQGWSGFGRQKARGRGFGRVRPFTNAPCWPT